jgi:uncharacterized NAD-dependent epimerase/dehydratase family protein
MVRYQPHRVCCLIDSKKAGLSVGEVLGFGGDIPVVASLSEAMKTSPDTLLIGIAPRGGLLPDEWKTIVLDAISRGLNIISGLHTMLNEDSEISRAAGDKGVEVWDIRKPVLPKGVSEGSLRERSGRVVLTVGSDCRTGKMTVAYELAGFLKAADKSAEFVPTGQTGILLAGWGIAVDRVAGDFMSRITEDLTLRALSMAEIAVVEGQGSLVHPGYSGVTLAMLHGCCPDALVLCHEPGREMVDGYGIRIPPLPDLVRFFEVVFVFFFLSKVAAVALKTYRLAEDEAVKAVREASAETGLPATDVVRWGPRGILPALGGLL